MDLVFYLLVSLFGSQTSNAKVYSEDDFYITNSTNTYNNIPTDCNLFGNDFGEDYPVQKLIINITANGTYWIGAKISFKRNINPVGSQPECKANYNASLDECNRHCKGQKYFSYNKHSCTCSNDNKAIGGLTRTKNCENQEYGLCFDNNCVVYERDVLNNDYLCDAYQYSKEFTDWIFTTQNCSAKLSFICVGDKLQPYTINSSWLVADHMCSKKGQHLLQTAQILGSKFKKRTKYWISLFRRKKFSWGEDFTKTVCVAARIQANGSYRLESHFCNESLEALCHKPDHTKFDSSDAEITTASLGTVLGGVLVCIAVVAAIKNRRGHLQNIQTPPQEDINKSSTSTDKIMIKGIDEPLYSNSDDPVGDLSIYSLAKDHSEPGDNKDTPDKQYDSVMYKKPRNTDEDKHYDHIMENVYQNPYS